MIHTDDILFDLRSWLWQRPDNLGPSNDLAAFRYELLELAQAGGWIVEEIGPVFGESLPLLRRADAAADLPRVLIASGFHGEESAGPWGMLEFLRTLPAECHTQVTLTLLPLVNPTGFSAGKRFNRLGENPNRGWGRGKGDDQPSAEGRLLLAHGERLRALGRDGVLACHEDVAAHHTYAYTFEPERSVPGQLTAALLNEAQRHFALYPDGLVDGCPIQGGCVFNHYDGSFEAWLSDSGVACAACIETPGQQDFGQRVIAQAGLMQAFVAQRVSAFG